MHTDMIGACFGGELFVAYLSSGYLYQVGGGLLVMVILGNVITNIHNGVMARWKEFEFLNIHVT